MIGNSTPYTSVISDKDMNTLLRPILAGQFSKVELMVTNTTAAILQVSRTLVPTLWGAQILLIGYWASYKAFYIYIDIYAKTYIARSNIF